MKTPIYFDHLEAHVSDIKKYCEFLTKLFRGGRYKEISSSGTAMFITPDSVNFEIKKKKSNEAPINSGICGPCIRMENPLDHIENVLGLKIDMSATTPEGNVHFFTDHEGITWHVKDYIHKDQFINW